MSDRHNGNHDSPALGLLMVGAIAAFVVLLVFVRAQVIRAPVKTYVAEKVIH